MRLYTKTGDGGQTSIRGGAKVSKSSGLIAVLGKLDRINSDFGLAGVVADQPTVEKINRIQSFIFEIGAVVSNADPTDASTFCSPANIDHQISILESEIDKFSSNTPELKNFILPGGAELSARLHNARISVREAEHIMWLHIPYKTTMHIYINRLSDWCFACARYTAHQSGNQEIIWKSTLK